MGAASPFELREERLDAKPVLVPIGELDMVSAPALRDRLVELLREEPATVVVDCSKISFLDSTGLSVLAHAFARSEAAGGELRLCSLGPTVESVLRMSGLLEVLHVYPTADAAVAGCPSGSEADA